MLNWHGVEQDVAETDFVEYKEDLDSILTVIVPRMQTLSTHTLPRYTHTHTHAHKKTHSFLSIERLSQQRSGDGSRFLQTST